MLDQDCEPLDRHGNTATHTPQSSARMDICSAHLTRRRERSPSCSQARIQARQTRIQS